ncbi:MAG: polysaccharide deacetylase family protein [Thermoflexales bacterium]|nr:polysaccharide deacetylase family protein [Thermoflexales bacterium]
MQRWVSLVLGLVGSLLWLAGAVLAQRMPPDDAPTTPTPIPTPTPRPRKPPSAVHVPILMYHYVSEPPAKVSRLRYNLTIRPAEFEQQLAYLAENRYTTVSLYDLYAHLTAGTPLPPRPVVLTFDDGYLDAYTEVFPRLKRYGMTGTFFIVTDFINFKNPEHLTWEMVREMAQAGMSIEPHSRTHPDLRRRSHAFLVWEILGPIEQIEHYTGRRPRFFCYPAGHYDAHVIQVLKNVGIWAAVTTQPGTVHALANAYTWKRQRVLPNMTLVQFARLLEPPPTLQQGYAAPTGERGRSS